MNPVDEKQLEDLVVANFKDIGWDFSSEINRVSTNEVIDWKLLKKQIIIINAISEVLANKVVFKIKKIFSTALESNIKGYEYLKNGVKIFDNKQKREINVKLYSKHLKINKFIVVQQLNITNVNGYKRIPDLVAYLNGLPIILIELKAPLAHERLKEAILQNDSLVNFSPNLFTFNLFNVFSNYLTTKYGALNSRNFQTKNWNERFNPIKYLFNKKLIIEIIQYYCFFDAEDKKYLAGPHQIQAVEATINKLKTTQDNKGGIVWHTQGSGKSVTMLMLTKRILSIFPQSTIVVITDRKSLDFQLYQRFLKAERYLSSASVSVKDRNDLKENLKDKKRYGIFFTTIQKFFEKTGVLTKRKDIFVLVDEAHRSQNNLLGKHTLNKKSQIFSIKFGFAKYMRDAFPHAKLIGFTGTPLMGLDRKTQDVFGGYNHVYSMNDSVKEGATVKISYEQRANRIGVNLDKKYLKKMNDIQKEYTESLNANDIYFQEKVETLLQAVEIKRVLEDRDVIRVKTKDILKHLKKRQEVLNGKAMIVAFTRKAAFRYYQAIIETEPARKNEIILVVTHSNKDSQEMRESIVAPHDIADVENEFRKPNSKYKIAIVVDKWLTGFDVPDLDVMYLDKILKWHNLMQAIARVNRVYEDNQKTKESGLIVDYLGIWKYFIDALLQYASGDKNQQMDFSIEDIQKAKARLEELINIVNDNYIFNIKDFLKIKDSNEKYLFVVNAFEKIQHFTAEEKNQFIKIARKTDKLLKITYTILSWNSVILIKIIKIVNSLLSFRNIHEDRVLNRSIDEIKKMIELAVKSSTVEVKHREIDIHKDVSSIARDLEQEAIKLRKNNPLFAKQLLIDAIHSQIQSVATKKPYFAKKASEKLKEIITKYQNGENTETTEQKMIEALIFHSKFVSQRIEEEEIYADDPHMQEFHSIVSDDKWLKKNKSSEVLKEIAEELMKTVKEEITDQVKNPRVWNQIEHALRMILKNRYNYPPQESSTIALVLVDKIRGVIEYNSDYFLNKKMIELY